MDNGQDLLRISLLSVRTATVFRGGGGHMEIVGNNYDLALIWTNTAHKHCFPKFKSDESQYYMFVAVGLAMYKYSAYN